MENKSLNIILLIVCFTIIGQVVNAQNNIRAYYTKINKGEDWEVFSRTTEHVDIVVNLNNGKLVFWRGTSYLPYWETLQGSWPVNEVIERSGDGSEKMPDKVNMFSSVKIISSTPEQVKIHWRYLPSFEAGNPKRGVDPLKFVDEYFTISSDGNVLREIKTGTKKYDDWSDPVNMITERFSLSAEGIKDILTTSASLSSGLEKPVKGNLELGPVIASPVMHYKFDEAVGDKTLNETSLKKYEIEGHKAYWKKGVSGTALALDGYTSGITIPAVDVPDLASFTFDAWVALPAYPFNWVPIVHQSTWEKKGFYFGIDGSGKLGLKIQSNNWQELTSKESLPLGKWTHIAATYDGIEAKIFIDGSEVAAMIIKSTISLDSKTDMIIGRNNHLMNPVDPVRPECEECHTEVVFSHDGLLDDLKIYKSALTAEEIQKSYNNYKAGEAILSSPDLEKRVLPNGPTTGKFKAHYTSLKFYETWDNLARFGDECDIVVEFDETPNKYIFWRGMSYVPQSVNPENQWYCNQFNESWEEGGSWGEPMSDKTSNLSHVRIIEDHDARKVIHWRYAQIQINGTQQNYDAQSDWGDWSDWYFYIYPDGVVSKRMLHWSEDNPADHEWQESIGIMGPGETPEDLCNITKDGHTITLANLNDTITSYSWYEGNPRVLENYWEEEPCQIQLINYNSDQNPFTIADAKGVWNYDDSDNKTAPYSTMVVYNHWPIGQIPSDGFRAINPSRTSSNGYTHMHHIALHKEGSNWAEKTLLEGMTDKGIEYLRILAKSWMRAPQLIEVKGATTTGYDQPQRAYIFNKQKNVMSFTLDATKENPIENVCFVIKDWKTSRKARLLIDGEKISSGKDFRQGIVIDTDGTNTMIIYTNFSATAKTHFEIK